MNSLVSLKNVSKMYADKLIFCNVSMSVKTAKPIVIMGKNGCGKSTLLKIIAGVLRHTEGEISRMPKIKISYMPDRFPKLPFKVWGYLRHMGRIQGISDMDIKNYVDMQFEYLSIPKNIMEQKIHKCSKGTIQKINIMQAFMSKPDLLVVDEPFSGLDEGSIDRLIELLAETAQNETAIILSCHEKVLAQRVTDNLFVFDGQKLIKSSFALDCMRIKFIAKTNEAKFDYLAEKTISIIKTDKMHEVLVEKDNMKEVLFLLLENGHEVYSVNPVIHEVNI